MNTIRYYTGGDFISRIERVKDYKNFNDYISDQKYKRDYKHWLPKYHKSRYMIDVGPKFPTFTMNLSLSKIYDRLLDHIKYYPDRLGMLMMYSKGWYSDKLIQNLSLSFFRFIIYKNKITKYREQ